MASKDVLGASSPGNRGVGNRMDSSSDLPICLGQEPAEAAQGSGEAASNPTLCATAALLLVWPISSPLQQMVQLLVGPSRHGQGLGESREGQG